MVFWYYAGTVLHDGIVFKMPDIRNPEISDSSLGLVDSFCFALPPWRCLHTYWINYYVDNIITDKYALILIY